jgi:protein-disulfide isomerase
MRRLLRVASVIRGAGLLLIMASPGFAQQARRQAPTDVVATVGTVAITLEQVDQKALQQPAAAFGSMKLVQAVYEARRDAADELIGNILLDQEAKRRGVSQAAVVEQEISAHVAPVSEDDVRAWFQANPQRVQGATLDQVRLPIQQLLTEERTRAARDDFLQKLKVKTPVRVMLEPPRQSVGAGTSPARGPAGAPIELIEFADFECPYCRAAAPTVARVLATYGDRIRFVYRNYPLAIHPNARPAAEAAQCANEQGQFWPYHDRLFAAPDKLSDADLKQTAADIGMDGARFNRCVDEHAYKSTVDADAQAGADAGVTGTPAFFINGRMLSGAQPYEAFARVIDEELALKKNR